MQWNSQIDHLIQSCSTHFRPWTTMPYQITLWIPVDNQKINQTQKSLYTLRLSWCKWKKSSDCINHADPFNTSPWTPKGSWTPVDKPWSNLCHAISWTSWDRIFNTFSQDFTAGSCSSRTRRKLIRTLLMLPESFCLHWSMPHNAQPRAVWYPNGALLSPYRHSLKRKAFCTFCPISNSTRPSGNSGKNKSRKCGQARRQDLAAGGAKNQQEGPKAKRGATFLKCSIGCMQQPVGQTWNGGAGHHWLPRWRRPWMRVGCCKPLTRNARVHVNNSFLY